MATTAPTTQQSADLLIPLPTTATPMPQPASTSRLATTATPIKIKKTQKETKKNQDRKSVV